MKWLGTGLFVALLAGGWFYFAAKEKSDDESAAAVSQQPASKSDSKRFSRPEKKVLSAISTDLHEPEDPELAELRRKREQVEAYVEKYKRSAESLITAFEVHGDPAYLDEALEKYPDDPFVQFAEIQHKIGRDKELSPEVRAAMLEKFKAAMPENALGNYLSALEFFKSGDSETAMSELANAMNKPSITAFYKERLQSQYEFHLLSGLTPGQASDAIVLVLPFEGRMKAVSQNLLEMQTRYADAGDLESTERLAALNVNIARKWGSMSGAFGVTELVGFSTERKALEQLQPDRYYDFLGKTAGERIQELTSLRNDYKQWFDQVGALMPQLTDEMKQIYFQRAQLHGEAKAAQWLLEMHGEKRN